MTLTLDWSDIVLRLVLAFLAGTLFGFDRGEHGKPAGLRTTLLVCLAAALGMILANLMIATRGKTGDSFVQLDMMRLPLGVLTGIGFIGAGAIIKRGEMVVGVTTAAILWFVTMIGLAFGAGQYGLGLIGLTAGLLVLWGLRWVEDQMKQERRGTLIVCCDGKAGTGLSEQQVRDIVLAAGCKIATCSVRYGIQGAAAMIRCELRWHDRRSESRPPGFLQQLAGKPGVRSVRWHT